MSTPSPPKVFTDDGNGGPGALVAFVEQKRMTFREQVTLYADESKQHVLAAFRARKVIDLASAYDVTTGEGQPIGVFGKQFGKSLLRSTWRLEQPGLPPVEISERSMALALFRRIWVSSRGLATSRSRGSTTSTSPATANWWAASRRRPGSGTTTWCASPTRRWTAGWCSRRPWRWTPSSPDDAPAGFRRVHRGL
ncbi:hypothetical protein AMETH_0292 [Amycolatopsis methanolica 239]|uniref:Uncharacterized protein n=1 Tax=Amycolatopsis methanolica 239 TaxID=1068978 RepID=A0A076MI25_AMYME|nr:hypothetical protein AMETH_0292 [Amycolatopsis methanolica 239]